MPKARACLQATSGEPQIHKLALAIQEMGNGYSREVPHCTGAKGLPPDSDRLLFEMDQGRSTQQNNRSLDQKVHMDKYNHTVWGSRRNRH